MCEGDHPQKPSRGKFSDYWHRPVSELVKLHEDPIPDEQKERHCLYLLMLMSLVAAYWNPFKKGRDGEYGFTLPKDRQLARCVQ